MVSFEILIFQQSFPKALWFIDFIYSALKKNGKNEVFPKIFAFVYRGILTLAKFDLIFTLFYFC